MAASVVQSAYGHSATDAQASPTGAIASSNQLIVFAQSDQASTSFAVTDSAGNTYTELFYSTTAQSIRIMRRVAPAASTITVTADANASFTGVTVIEIAGGSTGALDVAVDSTAGTSSAATTPLVTPSGAGLALAFMARPAAGGIDHSTDWT